MLEPELKSAFLRAIVRPLARFCLKHSVRVQDLQEACKAALLDAAAEQLHAVEDRPNLSRLSVMTGLQRKDIKRLQSGARAPESTESLIVKVLGLWQNHPNYLTASKTPKALSLRRGRDEFAALVAAVSRDLNPATVLFELKRVGAAAVSGDRVRLLAESYIPSGDIEAGLKILSDDFSDLFSAVEQNLFQPSDLPHLHRRTVYDNVRPAALARIRKWLLEEGLKLHRKARRLLAAADQDVNPDARFSGPGAKVVLSTFSLTVYDEFKKGNGEHDSKPTRERK